MADGDTDLLIVELPDDDDSQRDINVADDDLILVDATRPILPPRQELRTGIAPVLPPDKHYHAFFSYSNEDEDWVRRVVNQLEEPQYGFKCCLADRDLHPGNFIFDVSSLYSLFRTRNQKVGN